MTFIIYPAFVTDSEYTSSLYNIYEAKCSSLVANMWQAITQWKDEMKRTETKSETTPNTPSSA